MEEDQRYIVWLTLKMEAESHGMWVAFKSWKGDGFCPKASRKKFSLANTLT